MPIYKALRRLAGGGFAQVAATDQIACDAGAMTVTETGGAQAALPDAIASKFPKAGGTLTGVLTVNLSGAAVSAPAGTVAQFVGNSSVAAVAIDAYGGSATPNPTFVFRGARGTAAAPTATQSGDILGNFSARGYGATGFASVASATIQAVATQAFTDSAQGTGVVVRVTPNGTVSKIDAARFDHNGYLGLNTATPGARLDVSGKFTVDDTGKAVSAVTAGATVNDGTVATMAAVQGHAAAIMGGTIPDILPPRRGQFFKALEAFQAGSVSAVTAAVPSDPGNATNIAFWHTTFVLASSTLAQFVQSTLGLTSAQITTIISNARSLTE